MPRLTRLTVPHQMHLVVQRGHGRAPVFVDDEDRRTYLDALRESATGHRVAIHAYVLLDDQVQWLGTPQDVLGLSRTVQAIGQRFVGAFNRRHGLRGTRWEGRFRSAVIDAANFGVSMGVLIEQEAVLAGLVQEPSQWPWSTARHHLGLERVPWIADSPLLWHLGNTPYEREAAYRRSLDHSPDVKMKQAVTNAVARGWAVGDDTFVQGIASVAGRHVTPRPRGRPRRF